MRQEVRRETVRLLEMTSAEKTSNGLAFLAFVLSIAALYFGSCQGPRMRVGLAPQAFFNAKPRVGLLANIQNDGATAGTIIGGELVWDSISLRLVMTSPSLDTWTYTDKGMMKEAGKTTFTFVSPFQIQGHSSQPATLWFSREEASSDRLFTSGEHALRLNLNDGINSTPAVAFAFRCKLDSQQIENIYSKGNETTEFIFPLLFDTR